jgi:hypothetical protein
MHSQDIPRGGRTTAALIAQADKELATARHRRAIRRAEERIANAPSLAARVDAQFGLMRAVGGDSA